MPVAEQDALHLTEGRGFKAEVREFLPGHRDREDRLGTKDTT